MYLRLHTHAPARQPDTALFSMRPLEPLDPTRRGESTEALERFLRQGLIGQPHVVDAILPFLTRYLAHLNSGVRPIANLIFLGPTGTGKTLLAELLAKHFHNDRKAMVRIACADFWDAHEVAKLFGAPPGYHNHKETIPRLHHTVIEKYSDPTNRKPAIILFDEIEKAHATFQEKLLEIMSNGTFTTGDNTETDFSNAILIFTSNLGAREMQAVDKGSGFTAGLASKTEERLAAARVNNALAAMKKHFSPEFQGRLDVQVVFRHHTPDTLQQVLALEMESLQKRLRQSLKANVVLHLDDAARQWLLARGSNVERGARDLSQQIERSLVADIANLSASGQITNGDALAVTVEADRLAYRHYVPSLDLLQPAAG